MSIQMPYKLSYMVGNSQETIFAHNPKRVIAEARPLRRKGIEVTVEAWNEEYEEYLPASELQDKVNTLNVVVPTEKKVSEGSLDIFNNLNKLSYLSAYLAPIARARALNEQELGDFQAAIEQVASLVEFPSEEAIEA